MTDAQIRDVFLRDIYAVLPQAEGIVQEVIIHRWEFAIPYIAPGRCRLQPALERPLGNVILAGDYFEFPEMEVAAVTGSEAAQTARDGLAIYEGAESRVSERARPEGSVRAEGGGRRDVH
jgi:oxygen-dependent protoporphyrinogen oxidase